MLEDIVRNNIKKIICPNGIPNLGTRCITTLPIKDISGEEIPASMGWEGTVVFASMAGTNGIDPKWVEENIPSEVQSSEIIIGLRFGNGRHYVRPESLEIVAMSPATVADRLLEFLYENNLFDEDRYWDLDEDSIEL